MSYFQEPADTLEEEQAEQHEQPRSVGFRFADLRDRIAGALASLDRGPVDHWGLGQSQPTDSYDMFASEADPGSRFPVDPLGYNMEAVDEHIARLERELDELRGAVPAMSINEEIKRLGEQTASILVVAHDKAHETTRLAQEQPAVASLTQHRMRRRSPNGPSGSFKISTTRPTPCGASAHDCSMTPARLVLP